jgi:hypothetical protein
MLDDPTVTYEHIANKFGLTKQNIAQLANGLSINGRRRQRERVRMLSREPRIIKVDYPPDVQAVINKIMRSGMRVTPYIFPAPPSSPYLARRSQIMVLVNGRLCTIQFRHGRKLRPDGRDYARFDNNVRVRKGKFALWAMRSGRLVRVYVIPLTHLRNVAYVHKGRVKVPRGQCHHYKPYRRARR